MKRPVLKSIVLLLVIVAVSPPASGQILRGFGLKAGVTSSDVRSPDLDLGGEEPTSFDTKRRTGVVALAYLEWLNLPAVSIVTEAGYIQRGYATELNVRDAQNNPAGTLRLTTRFDYVSFAAQAKVRLPHGTFGPYALAGPRLDIFVGGEPNEEGTLASAYSTTAFGGTIGVGLEAFRPLPVTLFGEIRYNFDVTNSLPDVPRDAYNNAIDLLIGVRF
jgi:hypothetical protein